MTHQKTLHRIYLILFISVLLSGCLRPATLPTVDLSQFTPQPAVSQAVPSEGTAAAINPTATPELDPVTQATLRRYPLWVGSSWVYTYIGYTQEKEVTWRVVETVVETQIIDGYYVATVNRTAELLEGTPGANFPYKPEEGIYYELVYGGNLYRSEDQVQTNLSDAWLDLVIPFPEDGGRWYPDPADRAMDNPPDTRYKFASDPYQQTLPEDDSMRTCYNVAIRLADGKDEGTFCNGIGFVYREATLWNSGEGFRSEMVGFSLQ
ncbi:hypothetical protein KQH50_02645 [bacterium]|nr:hypothetical protein [bacterium]